ncbi:hypothetical protein ACFX58_03580 [Sphingomonas sp. NCPPB 2930]
MIKPGYFAEGWYAQLTAACENRKRVDVAILLGVSAPTLSQVLNGSGRYGSGEASTRAIADRVEHTFGRYACPHLTEEGGGTVVTITAAQCRGFAHRDAPTGSPRDMQHWQACRGCPHKVASAPPIARDVRPRKTHPTSQLTAQEQPS